MSNKKICKRDTCELPGCFRPKSYYCSVHSLVLCNRCKPALHQRCNPLPFCPMESLQEDLSVSTQLFNSLQTHCILYKLEVPGDTLTIFVKELEKLTESIQSAIRNTHEVEYSILQQKVANFQSMVTESEVFREYSRDKIMRTYSGAYMSREIAKVEEDKRMMDEFLRMSEVIKDAYEQRKQSEIEKFERE
jgi:hypothetical protein